jgi:hypothetical protein
MASTEHHVAEEAIESPTPGEKYPHSIDEKNGKGSSSTELDIEVAVYFEEGDEVELRESGKLSSSSRRVASADSSRRLHPRAI